MTPTIGQLEGVCVTVCVHFIFEDKKEAELPEPMPTFAPSGQCAAVVMIKKVFICFLLRSGVGWYCLVHYRISLETVWLVFFVLQPLQS